jgi:hypothetical protein
VPSPANPAIQVLASIVGAVLSTLITSKLGASPTGNLIAAALGAAIPPFASYVGPKRHLRLGVALAATAIALFVTYGGVTLFDAAADKKTFPGPADTPTPTPTPTPGAAGARGGAVADTVNKVGISVTPDALSCTADHCDHTVKITSTGSHQLRIFGIEFEGDAKQFFHGGETCQHRPVQRATPCEFPVTFTPTSDEGTVTAKLMIHQNVGDKPSVVALEGSGGPAAAQGDFEFTDATCTLDPAPLVRVTLTVAAPDGTTEVPVRLQVGSGTIKDATIPAGEPAPVEVELAEEQSSVSVTVALDPDNATAEEHEDNNVRMLTCPTG